MQVVILCGGKGIRAFPFTEYLPKPMLPVAGSPIIMHVIKSFMAQGFDEFVLAAGYRQDVLHDYFDRKEFGAKIKIVDTGDETDTGGRVLACREHVGDTFIATYSDGLCDVPLAKLLEFHNGHEGLSTITSVAMYSQYGVLDVNSSGKVTALREKPLLAEHWINAGFIVFDKKVFEHWQGENLESDVFSHLIENDLVYTYRHQGFFKSLDSYKDQREFDQIVRDGVLPWIVKE
jgi:glucose-1-phosphate cytidylyltransferase